MSNLFDQQIRICGAIASTNAIAVCGEAYTNDNSLCAMFPEFFRDAHGKVLLIGSDEEGYACDLEVDKVLEILKLKYDGSD